VTLPDVGHRHADGHIMGVAAVMPKILGAQEEQQALATLASLGTARLKLGQLGAFPLERVAGLAVERGLRPDTWGAASRNWASVTPIVLDKFPKKPFGEEACAIVAESCVRAGFPMPVRVVLSPDSRFAGVQSSRQFPATERRGSLRRFHVHAILEFENLVGGPMIVGAGRYVGMGLCRPVLKGL
jgi:CRISPR-associated protein Csb2